MLITGRFRVEKLIKENTPEKCIYREMKEELKFFYIKNKFPAWRICLE